MTLILEPEQKVLTVVPAGSQKGNELLFPVVKMLPLDDDWVADVGNMSTPSMTMALP
jgi:hypothetical protein